METSIIYSPSPIQESKFKKHINKRIKLLSFLEEIIEYIAIFKNIKLQFGHILFHSPDRYERITVDCHNHNHRGGGREEQPHIQGAVAVRVQDGLEELSRVEGQEGRQ